MPMPPPPAETFASRLLLGPALRAQPDRRLVGLVREGYEAAFEEIVRRYGGALGRYAHAIVGGRAEDVTQDAFSKALQALRCDDREIELRPWLYRIVRNTALNDLRDSPPTPEELVEAIEGGHSAAEEVDRREELNELVERLRALPEPQRAAIVMRELEGLSHAEIAAALGVSGGGARQAIHRARQALRSAAGMLLPLPLLKALLAGGTMGSAEMAAGAAGGAAGAGVALKATTATVLVAGVVGAGVAVDSNRHSDQAGEATAAQSVPRESSTPQSVPSAPAASAADDGPGRDGDDRGHGRGENGTGDDRGGRSGSSGHGGPGPSGGGDDHGGSSPSGSQSSGGGPGPSGSSGRGSSGSSGPGGSGSGESISSGDSESSGSSGSGEGGGGGGPGPSGEPAPEGELESGSGSGSGSDGGGD
jgi:RNA polymerase sigma factor (sigma-70 family)